MNDSLRRFVFMPQGIVGLLLIAIFWPLNWLLPDSTHRTAYLFFPLWLGYILTVDAAVFLRAGNSLWSRSRKDFVLLFIISGPAWWLFEVFNWRTHNWQYLGGEVFTGIEYNILSTISFSTVMPAAFETAEFVATFQWVQRFRLSARLPFTRTLVFSAFLIGVSWLTLVLIWPRRFYPLMWGAVFLIIEPVNAALGRTTLFRSLNGGDWRPVIALSVGSLICGFFWEMWNYYSFPKWIYHTPGAEFAHVFEMPLLGYLGYLPFAWELYALRNLMLPFATDLRLAPND